MLHTKKHHKYKEIPKLILLMALFKTIEEQNIAGVRFLLEHGVNPNKILYENFFNYKIALDSAVKEKNVQIVELLLMHGANPNGPDFLMAAPLHRAVLCSTPLTKILLENGALVNIKDIYGYTPLHSAIRLPHKIRLDTIKLLLQYDADLTIKIHTKATNPYGGEGKTPITLIPKKKKDLKALLELEQLYRNEELDKIVKKTYIKEPHIKDFIKWKIEDEIPKFIKSNISLLNQSLSSER